jgi:hypothetical protein
MLMTRHGSRGVVYVAWGEKFISEAKNSANSVIESNGYWCVLITDKELLDKHPFSQVIVRKFTDTYRDKLLMQESPFENTIFLDTDTTVIGSLDEVFQLLDRFDIAFQAASGGIHYSLPTMPMEAFPEPSAGIVAWKKNERTNVFFTLWDKAYVQQETANGPGAWDQRSMRQALWESEVSITMLPGVWQVYSFDVAICLGKVRMIHGRGPDAASALLHCNDRPDHRVYIPKVGFYHMYKTSEVEYLRLSLTSFVMFLRRGLRLFLHRTGIYRLPENVRPM